MPNPPSNKNNIKELRTYQNVSLRDRKHRNFLKFLYNIMYIGRNGRQKFKMITIATLLVKAIKFSIGTRQREKDVFK